ncbi:MAG: WD40 repeat domain-containing protein [Candidatus Poribacteria bacterium]|nr:WD40 repeat domain-containing protein [Candidatus Poribacteria bacterium]
MKRLRFLTAIHLFACISVLLSGCTQDRDYTQWGLPEGAKLRIGRGRVKDIKFSPDGQRFAVATSVGIWLYDTETYAPHNLIAANKGGITAIAFSADSRRLAGGRGNCRLSVWDARSGNLLKTFGEVVGGPVEVVSVAFSPDGRRLMSFARYEDTLRVWDVRTGNLLKTFRDRAVPANSAAFSPDGQILALGAGNSRFGLINLWDAETGEQEVLGPTSQVVSMVFSPDSRTLAAVAGFDDTELYIWDAHTEKRLHKLIGHTGSIYTLAFSSKGRVVAGGQKGDTTLRMWDTRTGDLLKTFKGHTDTVRTLAFSANGDTLASASSDSTLRLWSPETGQEKKVLMEHIDWGRDAAFSPDGEWIASVSGDDKIHLWDRKTGGLLRTLTGHTGAVTAVDVSSDGRYLASIARFPDNTLRFWNPETGELLKTISDHKGVNACAFSPDSQTLASAGRDATVQLWDAETGSLLKTFTGNGREFKTVVFSPDGQLLASGGWLSAIHLWNVETGRLLKTLGEKYGVETLAFSPGGRFLASGGGFKDPTIRLWYVPTGEKRLTLTGHKKNPTTAHTSDIYSVAFSPDGTLLASSGIDGIRLWNPTTGRALVTLTANRSSVSVVAFSSDSRTLASGESGGIFLWDVDTVLWRYK